MINLPINSVLDIEKLNHTNNTIPDCANSVGPSVKSDKMISGPIKVLILPVRSPVNKMTTVYCRV